MAKGKAFPKSAAAREAILEDALSYLRGERKGQPTHNRDVGRKLGIRMDAQGIDRLYLAMKADPRFIFRPDGLPASFKPAAPRPRRRSRSKKAEAPAS